MITDIAEACLKALSSDLSFSGKPTDYATHGIHSFAAKFPPQLPRLFIEHLTKPGDLVLDPMVGSGTTLVECLLSKRLGVGVDIDPLAVLISRCKTTKVSSSKLVEAAKAVCGRASIDITKYSPLIGGDWRKAWEKFSSHFDEKTKEFIDYWFRPQTAVELACLARSIEEGDFNEDIKTALKVSLSSIIVTKSGGVSLARDLAHSRPHRDPYKKVESAIALFKRKVLEVAKALLELPSDGFCEVVRGDARCLPLEDEVVDLIVTSPPYAIAIDYVRAHKFSLIWLSHDISDLSELRKRYIGAEQRPLGLLKVGVPEVDEFIGKLVEITKDRGLMVVKYFLDMRKVLAEMHRVLRPEKPAIIVVGPSVVKGLTIPTGELLAKIGESLGFKCLGRSTRPLDRNKRYLPVSSQPTKRGIEARIHEEEIIALIKE
jgi:DNA modification methylase